MAFTLDPNAKEFIPSVKSHIHYALYVERIEKLFKLQQRGLCDEELYDFVCQQYPNEDIGFINDYHQFIKHLDKNQTYLEHKALICCKQKCIFMRRSNRYNGRRDNKVCKLYLNINRMLDQLHILIHQHLDETECKNEQNERRNPMNNHLQGEANRFVAPIEYLEYSEGKAFFHSDYVQYKYYDDIRLGSKFNDIKAEIAGRHLTLEQFENETNKALLYMKSDNGKRLKATRYAEDYCGIPENDPITINHMLSLLFYTNYDALQKKLSMTYRKSSKDESDEELHKRHSEFFHFGKFLFETIYAFGNAETEKNQSLYRGITKLALFNSMEPSFGGPVSMTTSKEAALNFATNKGSVVEFNEIYEDQYCHHFDCALWSDFASEHEILFMNLNDDLKIVSVLDTRTGIEYDDWYRALLLFEWLFITFYELRKLCDPPPDKLNELILSVTSKANQVPEIIAANFKHFRQKVTHFRTNPVRSPDINETLVNIYENVCFDQSGNINLEMLTKLFPKLRSVDVKSYGANYKGLTEESLNHIDQFLNESPHPIQVYLNEMNENDNDVFLTLKRRHPQKYSEIYFVNDP